MVVSQRPPPKGVLQTANHTTAQLGKIAHYGFDAILISAFLAGVKRSTGLS